MSDLIVSVLTIFNTRQTMFMKNTIADADMAGLKAMLEIQISRWLEEELRPVEAHFTTDAKEAYQDLLERFLMYLVVRHGEYGPDGEYGRNVSRAELNTLIGADASLDIENDQSITLTVRKS